MGSERDFEARMETVAKRVEVLELLGEEGPIPPRDIVEMVELSRPTVTRALKELREANLVERGEGGYSPTLAGVMAADEYRRYETASEAILSADDLLAPIPETYAPPVEVLVGADRITAETAVPVRALEAVSGRVQNAERVRAYLPTLVDTHFLRVWHRVVVATAVRSEAVFDPELLTVLKGQYPHLLAEMAATGGFDAYATTGPPYGIVLTTTGEDTSLAVVVYENDTAVTGVLTNDSAAAVEWAQGELDRLAGGATEVTEDLAALSSAVADGLAQPLVARSDSTSSPSGSTHSSRSDPDAPASAADHPLPIDLEAEGFVRLSGEYFTAHGVAAPSTSWRTGFTLAEVRAGHAVDRLDAEGRDLTEYLVDALHDGTDYVVLGPPGSGKSTACMAVACEWFDRGLGPVLYRERGDGDRLESTALLEAYIRQTDGHTLVVVEDAVRDEANATFEVMQALDADPSVTFLVDARTQEWRDPDAFDLDARRDAYRRTALTEFAVPDLDERACERFVEHFSELVGADLDLTGADLFAMVEEGTTATDADDRSPGEALVAQYYLAQRYDPPADADASATTALDEAARDTYRTLVDDETRFAPDLAVLVALLTAAGVPVAGEYLYAIGTPEDAASGDEPVPTGSEGDAAPGGADGYAAVDEAVSLLEGRMLFAQHHTRVGSPTTYRTRHETWAIRFLEQFHAIEPASRARTRVGRVITRLLDLADEPARRERIQRYLGGRTPHLHQIEADPQHWADELVERLLGIGRTDARLAPLFGETKDGPIELPAACSPWTDLQQAYWRGLAYRTHGDLARAEREFRTLGELAQEIDVPSVATTEPATPEFASSHALGDDDEAVHRTRWLATSRTELGRVARDSGEYEPALEYHHEALALFREIDDSEGEAVSRKNLGTAAFYQGDYEEARNQFERSRAVAEDIGARRLEADCLNSLGSLATRQSEYDAGREYFERSLVAARDLGDRQREASSLNNLGAIATHQGDYDQAREYCEMSLSIERAHGNRQAAANSLNNLGQIARKQGAYDRGREYLEESLAVRRSISDKTGMATSLVNLGGTAIERGAHSRARDFLDQALETYEEIGAKNGIAEVRLERGKLALAEGDIDGAREHAREALDTFAALELEVWVARSRRLLGRVAAAADSPDEARDHWQKALETFETVDAPPGALSTLSDLIELCREQGDEERAREWCERSRETLAAAPDATAALHRDWVERHATELGVE